MVISFLSYEVIEQRFKQSLSIRGNKVETHTHYYILASDHNTNSTSLQNTVKKSSLTVKLVLTTLKCQCVTAIYPLFSFNYFNIFMMSKDV